MLVGYVFAGMLTSYVVLFYRRFGDESRTRALGKLPGTLEAERTAAWIVLGAFLAIVITIWPVLLLGIVMKRVKNGTWLG